MEEPGSRSAEAAGLRIDAVEVLPTDLRAVLLRVAGAWEGPPPEPLAAPVLVLREFDRRHRIDCLPETSGAAARAAPETQPFRAAFSVPDALAPLLEESIELDLGPLTVRLPAPAALEADPAETEGTVVDPAVLAARRARRAELAEETNLPGGGEAAGQLEGELGKLELRLAAAAQERAALEARLAARENEAREASELRQRLRESDEQVRRVSAELEDTRRRADDAERTEEETTTARAELADAMARARAMRRELGVLRREIEAPEADALSRMEAEAAERASALAAAESAIAAARDTVGAVQAALERERTERAAAEAEARERLARERAELEGRVAALELQERELSERVDAERGARRAAEAELEAARARIGELERALGEQDGRAAEQAAALARLEHMLEELGTEVRSARAAAERPAPDPALTTIEGTLAELRTALERTGSDFEAALEAERARTRTAEAQADAAGERQARAESRLRASEAPWLEDGLRRLARADAAAGARLALQLLPGQALAVTSPLDYEVDVAGLGRQRIAVRPGDAESGAPAGRRWRRFRVVATPAGVVKLVVGGGAAGPAGVRAARTLRRRRALRRVPAVPLRLGALARVGVLPDPGLLYRALALAIDPEWTRGHRFTVALEITGPRGGTWHVRADDGARVAVDEAPPGSTADAVVHASQVGLQHLLDGEAPPAGEKAAMRGDASAIGLLGQWSDRARGLGGARNVRD
jgi:hypothetical protein